MQDPDHALRLRPALTANAATSSCRTPIHSIRRSSRSASVSGLSTSPTTPHTCRTPCSASAATMVWATLPHADRLRRRLPSAPRTAVGPKWSGTRRPTAPRPTPFGRLIEQLRRAGATRTTPRQEWVWVAVRLRRRWCGVRSAGVQAAHRGHDLDGRRDRGFLVAVPPLALVAHVQRPGPAVVLGRDPLGHLSVLQRLRLDAAAIIIARAELVSLEPTWISRLTMSLPAATFPLAPTRSGPTAPPPTARCAASSGRGSAASRHRPQTPVVPPVPSFGAVDDDEVRRSARPRASPSRWPVRQVPRAHAPVGAPSACRPVPASDR